MWNANGTLLSVVSYLLISGVREESVRPTLAMLPNVSCELQLVLDTNRSHLLLELPHPVALPTVKSLLQCLGHPQHKVAELSRPEQSRD